LCAFWVAHALTSTSLRPMRTLLPLSALVFSITGAALIAACSSTPPGTSSGGTSSGEPAMDGGGGGGLQPVAMPDGWQAKAATYLEARTGKWMAERPCANTCHTAFPYLMAKHVFPAGSTAKADEARAKFVARVAEGAAAKPYYGAPGEPKQTESWATEAVLNAVSLSMSDLNGPDATLSADSKKAFERLWATQNAEGTWPWLEFGLYPWETRLDWGTTVSIMAAKTAGETANPGYAKAVAYMKKRAEATTNPVKFHDRVALLWARGVEKDLLSDEAATAIIDELAAMQLEDGGFSLGTFGIGSASIAAKRAATADGYATALATLALCSTTDGKKREDVRKAITWISKNQQADGSWIGLSINKEAIFNHGLMTDAATAYTALAVATCNK
jgi:squalene-hopene/tetraprenyl-beta-curcumene cyclase